MKRRAFLQGFLALAAAPAIAKDLPKLLDRSSVSTVVSPPSILMDRMVVSTLAERNALHLSRDCLVNVLDATGDPFLSPMERSAVYVYQRADRAWTKIMAV